MSETNGEFFCACEEGDVEGLVGIIGEILDINVRFEKSRKTGLHLASNRGHVEIVKILIENGADVNIQSTIGWTPLHVSCLNGKFQVCKVLVENGANVNCSCDLGSTPLHLACRAGHYSIVRYLVNEGADFNTKDIMGSTPLNEICISSFFFHSKGNSAQEIKKKIASLLISLGASTDDAPDLRNVLNVTELEAAKNDRLVLGFLLSNGS